MKNGRIDDPAVKGSRKNKFTFLSIEALARLRRQAGCIGA